MSALFTQLLKGAVAEDVLVPLDALPKFPAKVDAIDLHPAL